MKCFWTDSGAEKICGCKDKDGFPAIATIVTSTTLASTDKPIQQSCVCRCPECGQLCQCDSQERG